MQDVINRPDTPPVRMPIPFTPEVGTFQIFTSNERTFKTNTKTGETWIYNPQDACWFKTKD